MDRGDAGAADERRTTSAVGKVMCIGDSPWRSGCSMRSTSRRTASSPSAWIDWSTVVSGGSVSADSGMLSKPTTDRSSGTRRPTSVAVRMIWIADRSLAAKIAVGRGARASRARAGAAAVSSVKPPTANERRVEGDAGLVEGGAVPGLAATRRLEVGAPGEEPDAPVPELR